MSAAVQQKAPAERKDDMVDEAEKIVDNASFDEAVSIEDVQPARAAELYHAVLAEQPPADDTEAAAALTKIQEEAVTRLAALYARTKQAEPLRKLLVDVRPLFGRIAKSRTAKIVRALIDTVITSPELSVAHTAAVEAAKAAAPHKSKEVNAGVQSVQVQICLDAIAWCSAEKRTFLKQRLQSRLASLYVKLKQYTDALPLIQKLIRDVKKFDDKLLLVEIFLVESRAHLALQNVPKSKGALTAARSNANSIYCPPVLQAEIDLQAGILCSVESDFKTAFSYFYEAFEGYSTLKDTPAAVRALKYMLLSKIMGGQYEDVYAAINGKAGVKYAGIEIAAMRAITDAYKARSIHKFQQVYAEFAPQLAHDLLLSTHLGELQEKLLEHNLLRLLEPFSHVQIAHVATLIKLDRPQVEAKLSEMILDNKLNGILDQGTGDLILFDEQQADKSYTRADGTVKELNSVVDRLYQRAKHLTK